ncbi:hypothetical protein [Methylorubrum extorquens]
MARRQIITQAAIARAVKGAQAAGLKVSRVEIEGGRVVVYSSSDMRPETTSDFDAWRAKRDAR